MLFNLLADEAPKSDWTSYIVLLVVLAVFVVGFIISGRKNKKREEEMRNTLDAVAPGHKVKTIGGICGIVVEVNAEDNTFVLETGSEATGKCYIKFDKQAIYQTDALKEKEEVKEEAKEETKEEVKEEAKEANE